jgi:hypothetical protein
MRRNEQARMLIGLAIPGSGPAAGPAVAPPAAVFAAWRRWLDVRVMLTRVQSWSRRHGLEGYQVACSLTLLACGVVFGLMVGGYVGFIEAAPPPADSPCSLGQPATSDVGWTAMMRQHRSALLRPSESAAGSGQETPWQRLAGGAAAIRGDHSICLDTSGFRAAKKAVVTR